MKNLITWLAVCVCISVSNADTWTVNYDGTADFNTIQAAIDASMTGDEIIVMPGTYTSTTDQVVDITNKSISISSAKGNAVTFIDGQFNRIGINCTSDSDLSIDGFTITNCTNNKGAGIACDNSVITVQNCVFDNNSASAHGGGAHCLNNSLATFDSCTFTENQANNGGAIGGNNSQLTVMDCSFEFNHSSSSGGAIRIYLGPSLAVYNSVFSSNTSSIGGAIRMISVQGASQLEDCIFSENTATTGAGVAAHSSLFTCTSSTFSENAAKSAGGGVQCSGDSSDTIISDSYFCQNIPEHLYGCIADDSSNTYSETCPSDCLEDLNNDFVVNVGDLLIIFQDWGECVGCSSDITGDGFVEANDILAIVAAWGICP